MFKFSLNRPQSESRMMTVHLVWRSVDSIFLLFLFPLSHSGVSIGFRETVYSVDESTGQVVVNVEVLSGTLSENVVVRFNTIQGSATGRGLHLSLL